MDYWCPERVSDITWNYLHELAQEYGVHVRIARILVEAANRKPHVMARK